jgi:hypothetical protein
MPNPGPCSVVGQLCSSTLLTHSRPGMAADGLRGRNSEVPNNLLVAGLLPVKLLLDVGSKLR